MLAQELAQHTPLAIFLEHIHAPDRLDEMLEFTTDSE